MEDIVEFLENCDLYEDYVLVNDYKLGNENFALKEDFENINFRYYCDLEESNQTFQLFIPEKLNTPIRHSPEYGETIPDENFIGEKLNFTFWIGARCKSCEEQNVHFLFNVKSDKPISPIRNNVNNKVLNERHKYAFPNTKIIIRKAGCFPERRVQVNKSVSKHFDPETNGWYYKAKSLISRNYGIGAFAYLRRIIEKELIKIIEEIKGIPDADEKAISALLAEYKKDPTTSTIYENIFKYLPNSLKSLPRNPIKFLWQQTSGALHGLSEEECLLRGKDIVLVLEFTFQKINEEKSDIRDVKEAIKRHSK